MCFSERPVAGLFVTDVFETADRLSGDSGPDESASILLTENDETIFVRIFSPEEFEFEPEGDVLGEWSIS